MTQSTTQLYDLKGRRKYLSQRERTRFLKALNSLTLEKKLFCLILVYTGCRISEALELTIYRIDLDECAIVLHTLKQREDKTKVIYQRPVPVPPAILEALHAFCREKPGRIWNFSRTTAWRIVKEVMNLAGVSGIQACALGLRHTFGVTCIRKKMPLSKIQMWMGHSNVKTTMIYLNIVGAEELALIKAVWEADKKILLTLDFTGKTSYLK